ncbi:response regulator transcription factor [Dactylosporangium sp. NPDC049525]|uniref:response regulator transcription factor n=1 Tax=Dactylosporangium sp. NPDC049525 TaxID=3154730 RepID=UPI003441F45C
MIRVAVVDDQALVRTGFVMLLDATDGIEVVGEAADGAEAVDMVRRTHPDVVLMDIRMPRMDGIEATRRICADPGCHGARVLVLTTFDQDDLVFAALHAGASGFLLKETRPQDLLQAIEVVAGGDALLAPGVTRRLIARFTELAPTPAPPPPAVPDLTGRERDVLAAVATGRSNREIGEDLHMGYGTVKTHVSHLLTKLGCRDRAQLVVFAYEHHITTPGNRH